MGFDVKAICLCIANHTNHVQNGGLYHISLVCMGRSLECLVSIEHRQGLSSWLEKAKHSNHVYTTGGQGWRSNRAVSVREHHRLGIALHATALL